MNVWGVFIDTDTVEVRMAALKTLLENSNYDLVLIQEAWFKKDYTTLASAFPYVSNYGSQGELQEVTNRPTVALF